MAATGSPASTTVASIVNQQRSIWLWLSDDLVSWETFHPDDSAKIEKAQVSGHKGVVLQPSAGSTGKVYLVDILGQTQTNVKTGRRRPIQQVKTGSTWLFSEQQQRTVGNTSNIGWEGFSKHETAKLQDALFSGSEFVILRRGSEGESHDYYVDLPRWTMTNLMDNTCYTIKVVVI